MKKLQAAINLPILAATALGMALLALGIGFLAPTGEQSKLEYQGNLWCVSNYIEERDANNKPVYLADGRPRQDKRLDGKTDWIRRDQVEADSKGEAEKKATRVGFFEASNQDRLRQALDSNDKEFFIHHFNTGATQAGPCLGTGSTANSSVGLWVNDMVRNECFDIPTGSGNKKSIYNAGAFTAEEINQYLKEKHPNSPLNGKGKAFVEAGKKYGVNPGFMLGIADAESSLGAQDQQSGNLLNGTNNAFGVTAGGQTDFKRYSSYEAGIDDATRNATTTKYKQLDGTIKEFGTKWCGYETESQSPPVKLSDGTSITYDCKNDQSVWAKEVENILNGLIAISPSQPASPVGGPAAIAGTNPKPKKPGCPDQPPAAGPSGGKDYETEIAKAFERQYSIATGGEGTGTGESGGPLPAVSGSIAKVALSQVGYQGNGDCTKYNGCAQWCAYFVTWVYRQAGYPVPSAESSRGVLAWFQSHGHSVFRDPSQAGEGDIVVWARGENTGHIGIVVANNPSAQTMQIVEGNTSHDRVKLYTYSYDAVIHKQNGLIGFGRW